MKLIFTLLFLVYSLFANESLESIYENILLKNSKATLEDIDTLEQHILQKQTDKAKEAFKNLVFSWKSVEAFYILGDLDDAYLDMPRYIDMFHQGNENIQTQLDLILQSKENLANSLYKNSHKTINALEYILWAKDIKDARVQETAQLIIKHLEEKLRAIHTGYTQTRSRFVGNEQKANSIMLSALIENSYKLKEWRVGDVAGLSRKFSQKADNQRAEYALSQNSATAIEAILKTHLRVLEVQEFKNFGTLIHSYEATDALQEALEHLHNALKYLSEIKNDDFSNAQNLYNSLKKLHNGYYITLISKLKIKSKILDADGD